MGSIQRPCPSCHSQDSLVIDYNKIQCTTCSFEKTYLCPICNHSLASSKKDKDSHGAFLTCSSCHHHIHMKRIETLINNLMQLSHDHRCELCNGPTVYRTQANIGHRCFYFPKCSGQTSLFSQKKECLVFLDFETTGLEAGKEHIIEIGALKIDEDGFEHTFETFVKPPVKLPEKIVQITKITDEMLENAPLMDEVFTKFFDFIGNATIIAHNAEFDMIWLIIECLKYKVSLPNNSVICTFKWAKQLKEGRASLSALTKKYNIGHLNAHRALADAAATKELFFIFEDAKTVPRPVQPYEHFYNISKKIKLHPRIEL